MIPLSEPNFEGNEIKYATDAISTAWVSTNGEYVNQFEKQIANFVNVDNAVACQSGTAGIHLALVECGIGDNDLVLVPTLTFIATVNPVKYVGACPVFMDCDDSLCIDPIKIEKFCREECDFVDGRLIHKFSRKQVKAIIVVHVFGNMADMVSIMKIAKKYNLFVIEDAAEALGTRYVDGKYKGMFAGTIGDIGVYSFNGNKIITTGGGGAVVSHDRKLLDHVKYLSTQAKDDAQYYIHNEIGFNYRMTNVQAAIGVAQLEELTEFINRKNKNYEIYKKKMADINGCRLLDVRNDVYSNRWFYALRIDDSCDISDIATRLRLKGIQSRPIWGLIHEQKPYKKEVAYNIENAYLYQKKILNIPCSTNISNIQIDMVCKAFREIMGERK